MLGRLGLGCLLVGFLAPSHVALAQPTLQELWKRHDQWVLKGDPDAVRPLPPGASSTFTGKRGNLVQGWDVGPPHAPVFLWWQGGPGFAASPERDALYFEHPGQFRHVEINQPGTGASAWIPGWRPEDTVDDAVTFLRLRGIHRPVIVAGWSWGSTMALLFAQRHPELVAGVVVGGVWTNTPQEVRYYLGKTGSRSWIPGLSDAFSAFTRKKGVATDLHAALAQGKGGKALAEAYERAEFAQCTEGENPREPVWREVPAASGPPVDMASEKDGTTRFACIESEMMARGERGRWKLDLTFPDSLARVPLIVMEGRYDQVCMPRTARKVFKAWPGRRKLFVPLNAGHWPFRGPSKEELAEAGLDLTPEQKRAYRRAMMLHFGSGYLIGAAIDLLAHPGGTTRQAPAPQPSKPGAG